MIERKTQKELVNHLDNLNKDEFTYIGIIHETSGNRDLVDTTKDFLKEIGATKDVMTFSLAHEKVDTPLMNNFIYITIYSTSFSICKLSDIKKEYTKHLTKQKCVIKLIK
jgi:hypothetical protein